MLQNRNSYVLILIDGDGLIVSVVNVPMIWALASCRQLRANVCLPGMSV
jgi:hypothetical protein